MEKNTLEKQLTEVGAQVLKLHLKHPNNEEFGAVVRQVIKDRLNSVIKQNYLKRRSK